MPLRLFVVVICFVSIVSTVAPLQAQPAGESTSATAVSDDGRLWNGGNPFELERIWNWLLAHGPTLVIILVGALLLQWLVSVLSHRIVDVLTKRALRGTQIERENRARTLSSVFHNTSSTVIYLGALLIILDEVGIPIGTLLGGVAVIGLAVAFGAQNLIKDYFYGFMILLENQYGVNDVVRIAGIAGLVERITLRLTVLRDLEGTVHFVPHGEVKTVSNMTHGWARALFDIGVAYSEDPDRVMEILMQLGREMRADPKFGAMILDDPEMLGVETLGDSSVVIRFQIKTGPMQRWSVRREMLRRIKRKFDEVGIEIPFPSRTVYHRHTARDENKPPEG